MSITHQVSSKTCVILRSFTCLVTLLGLLLGSTTGQWGFYGVSKGQTQSDTLQGTVQATTEEESGMHRTTFVTEKGVKIYVNLPDEIFAGDTLTGTVFAEPQGKTDAEIQQSRAEIAGTVVEVNGQTIPATGGPFKLTLPSDFDKKALTVAFKNAKGKELARTDAPVSPDPPPSIPSDFALPTFGQMGRFIRVPGPFNGEVADTDHLKLGGKDMKSVVESPRMKVALNSSPAVGMSDLELNENGQIRKGEFRNLSLRMSAEKYNLRKGEKTTLHVEVKGLENLREPVPLSLENRSPGVMTLDGGNLQTLTITPADVKPGGVYQLDQTLTGIQVGAFQIRGTVESRNDRRPGSDQPAVPNQSGSQPGNAAAAQLKIGNATCYCKVMANNIEVAKYSKGGFDQLFQKEACRDYCRGIWDSNSKEDWARLFPNACGDVTLRMEAALGSAVYETVRGPQTVQLGGALVTECLCPAGQTLSPNKNYCVTSTGILVPGVPDQVLQGGYLVQSGVLYKINGPPCCRTYCKP